jgi:hypothetical protein
MVRESLRHQAYIVNMSGYGGMRVLKKEKSDTCKKTQEEIREMTIAYLLT